MIKSNLIATVCGVAAVSCSVVQAAADAPSSVATRDALVSSFRTNLDYCRQWLAAKDFKSLSRTAGQLPILADAISRHTREKRPGETESLREAISQLNIAASTADNKGATEGLEAIHRTLLLFHGRQPLDEPRPVKKTPAGFGPLMELIDGTFVDAKTALATDDLTEAKSYAVVLAELGQWLAADRNDERWRTHANDLVAAAQKAAAAEDSPALRAEFKNIYTRCEACHAVRRPK